METGELFYVCMYKREKDLLGHAVSFENDFNEDFEDQKNKSDNDAGGGISEIQKIYEMYSNSLMSYIDILPLVASLTPSLGYNIRSNGLLDFLESKSIKSIDHGSRVIFDIPKRYFSDFLDISNSASSAQSVGKQIPKMLIIGIVSSYEHHLSLIIREILRKNPSRLESSERQVSVKDVFDSGDISSFKDRILDKEIDLIMRTSFEEQVSWVEAAVGIRNEISAEYGDWPRLVEIFERRNLFTHTNGIVNDRYLKKSEKLKFEGYENLSKGMELLANPKYFRAALEYICDFGIKITQVCWRKIEKGSERAADDALGDFGFELIQRGRYNLAIKILEFFFSLKGKKDEERRLICLVNLANAYKLNGDTKKAQKLLDQEDWSVVNDTFRISVAAVQGRCEEVVRLMRKMGAGCDFGERAYEEWPIFFHVRDQPEFRVAFEEVFKHEYSPSPKKRRGILDVIEKSIWEETQTEGKVKRRSAKSGKLPKALPLRTQVPPASGMKPAAE